MIAVPVGLAFTGVVPWWLVAVLLGRDVVLAATLPVLRGRGVAALPITYIGKAATFAPDVRAAADPARSVGCVVRGRVIGACGWGFVIWGTGMYLWSAVLYLIQVAMVVRTLPKVRRGAIV